MILAAFPRNVAGKTLKGKLQEHYASRAKKIDEGSCEVVGRSSASGGPRSESRCPKGSSRQLASISGRASLHRGLRGQQAARKRLLPRPRGGVRCAPQPRSRLVQRRRNADSCTRRNAATCRKATSSSRSCCS